MTFLWRKMVKLLPRCRTNMWRKQNISVLQRNIVGCAHRYRQNQRTKTPVLVRSGDSGCAVLRPDGTSLKFPQNFMRRGIVDFTLGRSFHVRMNKLSDRSAYAAIKMMTESISDVSEPLMETTSLSSDFCQQDEKYRKCHSSIPEAWKSRRLNGLATGGKWERRRDWKRLYMWMLNKAFLRLRQVL